MSEYRLPLNVRLLAILIGSSLLLLILVLIVHRFQVKEQAGFFLEQARIAKEAAERFEDTDAKLEEIGKAAANYAKYLNQNPDNADVRAEYGLMLLDHAEKLARNQMVREAGPLFGESVIHLERVLRDEPDRQELRRKLVRSLSLLGSGSEAIQHLAILAAVPNDPDGLQSLFDRYELWTRGQPDQVDRGSEWRKEVLAKFLSADGKTVDRDRVVKWLQDDLWMVLEDQELLLDFARCQTQLSRPESAEKPLQKAIQLVEDKGQTDLSLYSFLASLLHELRRPNDAEYWISEAVNRNPDSLDANWIRGQYRVDLVRRSPKETAVVLAQGALWDATESIRKAIEQALDKADAATPPVEATALKTAFNAARAARSRGREEVTPAYRDRLIEAAKGLIALKPALSDTTKECDAVRNGLLLAANAELAAARLEETPADSPTLLGAEAFATAARELFPDHGPSYLVLADIDSLRGRESAAIEWLRQGRAVGENRLMLTWRLTMHLIRSGDLAEARKLIGELAEANAPEVVLLHLNALVAYSEKNWAEAKKGFDSVLPHLGDQPESAFEVNLLLADCCAKLGLVDQQREALENAAKLDWTSIRALLDLADVEMRSGQLDEAIEDYRRALRLPGAPPAAHLALTRAILAKTARLPKSERNWIEVDTALDEAKKALPDSPLVAILHADVLAARDQDRMAAELLTTTRDRLQGEINSLTQQRDALLAEAESLSDEEKRKRIDQAEQLANRIRGWKALQTEIWGSLVRLADRQKDWDASDKLIRNAEESLGDGVQARLLRARSLARRHGADAAPEIRKLLDNTEEFSAAERIQLWYTLAAIALNVGDYETARQNCRLILELEPANLDVHKLRFQLAATEGDIDEMDESLERIKQIEGKPSAFRHYAEARRLLAISEKGGSDELLRQALSQLTLAEQLSPRWEAISVLAGTIHEKLDQTNAAIDAYLEAIELGDDNPALVRRVAQLLIRANRLQEADRMFRQLAERQQVLSGDLERQISWVKTRMGDFDAAIDPARKTAAATNKTEDLVWLGQLLGIVGRRMQSEGQEEEARVLFDEGEQALRRAVVQKMDAPEPWIALIQFYGQAGQKEKARQTINRARLTLTTTAAATVLGQCYEVLDELDKAAEQYEIAVQANPKDPKIALQAAAFLARAKRIDEAKSHYLRVIQGKVDAETPMKAEARRGMASLLSEQGGIENRRLAIEWLDRNLAETPDSVADQVLKAAILASDPSGRRHHEALSMLEKLATGKQQISPQVRFALAQLYHADNNWRQYNLQMRKLLETYRDVPEYIAAYVNALTEKGDYVEADIWVSELARVAPNSPQTVALRAELAFAERQFDRTQKILRDYIEDPKATDSERDSRLPLIAESLESYAKRLRVLGEPETGRLFSEEANRVYRRYADAKPGRDLHMAAFLARQERIDDAITMVESLRESSHPDQLAVACFRIINGTGPSLDQLNRVDEILRKAIEQYPGNQILQIATAVVRSFQDRFEDAEALYRELLRQSPDNPTAMNNLAVLLARQGVKLDEAAKLIDRAIELAGENDELLESRAVVQLALKRPEKALEDLQNALGTKPTAMRFFHQAEAFRDIGQRKAAVEAFKKAGRMGLREEYLTGVELRKYKALKMALE